VLFPRPALNLRGMHVLIVPLKISGADTRCLKKKGLPEHLRSNNGPEFVGRHLRKWLADTEARTAYIESGIWFKHRFSVMRFDNMQALQVRP
jgi:hypothetical protein